MSEPIKTKCCSHCKQIKPISMFHKNKRTKDGLCYQCKNCRKIKSQSKQGRIANRIRVKKYRKTEKGQKTYQKARKKYAQSEKGKIYQKQWCLNHPESRKAKSAVDWAIRVGKLPYAKTLSCYYCPKPAREYHHWRGYALEHFLDVIPVCKKCHHYVNLPPAS